MPTVRLLTFKLEQMGASPLDIVPNPGAEVGVGVGVEPGGGVGVGVEASEEAEEVIVTVAGIALDNTFSLV